MTKKRLLLSAILAVFLLSILSTSVAALPSSQLYETYATGVDSEYEVYGNIWYGQTFTITPESHSAAQLRILAYREGSPGTVTISIKEVDDSGLPTGDDLTSGTFDGDIITTDTGGAWYGVILTEDSLDYGEVYGIVIRAEAGDYTNSVHVRYDGSTAGYTGGSEITSSNGGISWTADTDDDLYFEVHGCELIELTQAQIFSGYVEADDMLFVTQYYNTYTPYYPNSDPAASFLIQLREETALSEDFEWGSDGDSLETSGNTFTWYTVLEGTSKAEIDTAQYYSGTRSARLYRDGTNTPYAYFTQTALTPTQSIEFWFRKDADSALLLEHGDGANRIYILVTSDEKVQYYDGSWHDIDTVLIETWYLPSIRNVNWAAGTYDIYLDGDLIQSAAPMHVSTSGEDRISFNNPSGTSEVWLDDITIAGTTVIAQTTCRAWGYKPGAIYLNADTATGLTPGATYRLYICGDIAEVPIAYYTLTSADWRGNDLKLLDDWVLTTARAIGAYYYTALTTYGTDSEVLNPEGGVIFALGIPQLEKVRPNLFKTIIYKPGYTHEEPGGDFDTATDWETQIGTGPAVAITGIASIFGLEAVSMAGFMMLGGYLLLCLLIVMLGGEPVIAAILGVPFIIAGTWLRIIPIAFIAIIASVAVLLMVYRFWWSRT